MNVWFINIQIDRYLITVAFIEYHMATQAGWWRFSAAPYETTLNKRGIFYLKGMWVTLFLFYAFVTANPIVGLIYFPSGTTRGCIHAILACLAILQQCMCVQFP